MPPDNNPAKPQIIVVAESIDPRRGSEPAKGWCWSRALSRYFRLHIVTQEHCKTECAAEPIVQEDGWTFHTTRAKITTWKFPTGYLQYRAWLGEALGICREISAAHPIVGLCHVTLGSFRFLPRYDRLGIPYTVGPVGGGESAPLRLTWERPMPLRDKLTESLRPLINNSFALVPPLRSCLKSAAVVLATSGETGRVVRRMGAQNIAVTFSDSYDSPADFEKTSALRSSQTGSLGTKIRLLWQGRTVWWKGPDLALMVLRQAIDSGVRAELTMITGWDTAFGESVKQLAGRLGLGGHVHFAGNMSREEFLEMMNAHHGLLATSVHDSGGIPLVEAQSLGIPCLTPGLGGHRQAACPEAGVSHSAPETADFIRKAVACLARWQQNPATWLEESKKAALFSREFTNDRLKNYVRELIVPAFI